MQDKYAGDVGDYGKFHLLQCVEKKLKLGVNWYYTKPFNQKEKNNGDGSKRIRDIADLDKKLSKKLIKIFDKGKGKNIKDLEKAKLLNTKLYYREEVPKNMEERLEWHHKAIEYFKNCDIVFLDPDNGLKSKQKTRLTKYVLLSEIEDYINKGKSIILYSSRGRREKNAYFSKLRKELGNNIRHLSFHKGTLRDYIFIPANKKHEKTIKCIVEKVKESEWKGIFD